jgi:hypothetical protein
MIAVAGGAVGHVVISMSEGAAVWSVIEGPDLVGMTVTADLHDLCPGYCGVRGRRRKNIVMTVTIHTGSTRFAFHDGMVVYAAFIPGYKVALGDSLLEIQLLPAMTFAAGIRLIRATQPALIRSQRLNPVPPVAIHTERSQRFFI